jgi:chromosome segregation ATPase
MGFKEATELLNQLVLGTYNENNKLRTELAAEREKNIDLAFRLQDWHDSAQKAWKTPCADEQHCSCVPLLRKKCDELQSELEAERMEYEAYRETSIVEAEHLRAELEKLKRQWAEDDRDITELEDENNQLRAELAAEKTRVDDLRHFRKVFRDQRDGAEAQVEVLRDALSWLVKLKEIKDSGKTASYKRNKEKAWEHSRQVLANLPARAEATRKVLETAEEQARLGAETHCDNHSVYFAACADTNKAVRERREW